MDYSHAEDGYIMVFYYGKTDRRLKELLKGPTTTYNYNLPGGQWTVLRAVVSQQLLPGYPRRHDPSL